MDHVTVLQLAAGARLWRTKHAFDSKGRHYSFKALPDEEFVADEPVLSSYKDADGKVRYDLYVIDREVTLTEELLPDVEYRWITKLLTAGADELLTVDLKARRAIVFGGAQEAAKAALGNAASIAIALPGLSSE